MPRRPRRPVGDEQADFGWLDPVELLSRSWGTLLYEAPETSRILRDKAPRVPKVSRRSDGVPSYGLPFGLRHTDAGVSCWSCGVDLGEREVVRPRAGVAACPGCGARLPFVE